MSTQFGALDWGILAVYFVVVASIGPIFARRNKNTEGFFLGNRSFPSWLLGLAMFATSISSITVVAYPADAFKTAYLRLLPAFMLPVGIYLASKIFLPFYRRSQCTSAFEYLEDRFGSGVRTYISAVFLLGQVMRIATILYLVSLVFQQMTGQSPYLCILIGGMVIAIYTVLGGIKAIVWTQFIQAFLLWFGAFTCMVTLIANIDGGIREVIRAGMADHTFMLGDLAPVVKDGVKTQVLTPAPWFSLVDKAILLMLLNGLCTWLFEYSANQNVIQKYCSAKNPKEATRSIWICCALSVPTWAFFMFLGTSLYVYFQQNPSQIAADILAGANGRKAEEILPYFCVNVIPSGLAGIVITGILAAAMSASASSINAISAVFITDFYKRHFVKGADERHYVVTARLTSALSCLLMMGGAILFFKLSDLTLQDLGTKLGSLLSGGILGVYTLGFLTKRGGSRSVAVAIVCTILFLIYMTASEWSWITANTFTAMGFAESTAAWLARPMHVYYAGIGANILMFGVAFLVSSFIDKPRDLTNLTLWTTPKNLEEK